jgi:hypothetical protein
MVHLLHAPGHWNLEAASLEGREPEVYIGIRILPALANASIEAVSMYPVSTALELNGMQMHNDYAVDCGVLHWRASSRP